MHEHERTDSRFMKVTSLSNDVSSEFGITNQIDRIIKMIGAGMHHDYGAK